MTVAVSAHRASIEFREREDLTRLLFFIAVFYYSAHAHVKSL